MTIKTRGVRLRCAPFAVCALLVCSSPAVAADPQGQFAIKGGGQQSCGTFLTAWEERSSDLGLYAGWIDGYLTGLNQFTDSTYDLASWQTSDTLMGLTQSVCLQAPGETRFMDAFFQIVRVITPSRIMVQSPLVALIHEGESTVAYGPVIARLKARLEELGHGEMLTQGEAFDPATATAIAVFQEAEGLPATGLPDQRTLFELFHRR